MNTKTEQSEYLAEELSRYYNSDAPFGTIDISAISTGKPDPKPQQADQPVAGSCRHFEALPSYTQDPFAKHSVEFPRLYEFYPEDWRAKATTTLGSNVMSPDANVAVKHDDNKTDWSLMPWECVEEINKVLDFGARKYAPNNWRTGSGFSYTRVISSLLRHTFAWVRGEDLDPESGLSHLSHMGCNVIFLIYYNKHKARYNNDDRFKS